VTRDQRDERRANLLRRLVLRSEALLRRVGSGCQGWRSDEQPQVASQGFLAAHGFVRRRLLSIAANFFEKNYARPLKLRSFHN